MNKPPAGVMPNYLFYHERMRHLTCAINDYLWFIKTQGPLESARAYSSIAEWSEELTELAKREADRAKGAIVSKQQDL